LNVTCLLTFKEHSESVDLIDISLKGALVEVNEIISPKTGETCFLRIILIPSEISLDFETEVVHRGVGMIGLRFDHMDIDTMIHLRTLLEANTGDPDKIRDELHFLVDNIISL
jgi:hypothetical protein